MSAFKRLIRFEDAAGKIHYGEVPGETDCFADLIGLSVRLYDGTSPWDTSLHLTQSTEKIAKVLSPIPETPIVYGIGLNYRQHADEAKFPIPPHPLVFTKPSDALADPYEDIPIHKEAEYMDYEGELTVVIGRSAKNLTESDNPLDYVLGYTVGNDVSSRYWQDPVRAGGQHGYAKAFDKFAPIGPILCSTSQIPDPTKLTLQTFVNGEERQTTKTDDLIFDIPAIIRHLSRGRTLRPGTVIMSGTPSGVAAFMKPPAWLKDGDVVEVKISELGMIRNKMVFE